jgi:hypothetical protein
MLLSGQQWRISTKRIMSEELSIVTKDYITTALKNAQAASEHNRAWCHREPKKWGLVAQHIIQMPTTVADFLRKNSITRNFYYDVKTELMADPECQSVRNAWASELASIQFQGLDTFRASQDMYSTAIENGSVTIDGNELFKQAKALQAFNDIHGKLTGTNVQKIVVEHRTTLDEAEAYAREMLSGMQEVEIID